MKNQRMIEGNPLKLIFWFSLPLMLGNVFQQMYTVVDTAIVGQILGVSSLAAVGSADWICWVAFGVITGFPQGFSILIAQAYGANNLHDVKRNLRALIQCSVLVTILFVSVGVICLKPLLLLLQTPLEIIDQSYIYSLVIYLGLPITMLYNACASVLRAFGDSKTPLRAMILASLCNIILDLVCIIVFKMGVEGAALATIIAQMLAATYCFVVLRNNTAIEYPLNIKKIEWSLNYKMMKENNLQPRLLYPARISFKYEIKSFSDKQKLREFSTIKPALQQILKDIL